MKIAWKHADKDSVHVYSVIITLIEPMLGGILVISQYSLQNFAYQNIKIRENTKMLMVLADNIIDQNHFGNIIRTSLSNSTNSFGSI